MYIYNNSKVKCGLFLLCTPLCSFKRRGERERGREGGRGKRKILGREEGQRPFAVISGFLSLAYPFFTLCFLIHLTLFLLFIFLLLLFSSHALKTKYFTHSLFFFPPLSLIPTHFTQLTPLIFPLSQKYLHLSFPLILIHPPVPPQNTYLSSHSPQNTLLSPQKTLPSHPTHRPHRQGQET